MTTKRPRIWWASPCAGGTPYPDREEAELFGPPAFCAERGGYHARDAGDDWTALADRRESARRRRDEARPAPPDDAQPPFSAVPGAALLPL